MKPTTIIASYYGKMKVLPVFVVLVEKLFAEIQLRAEKTEICE